jgi:hypothetical protein
MAEPKKHNGARGASSESGARVIEHDDVSIGDRLPPTPVVMTNRPRIVTGRYSIVTPPKVPPAK